MNRLEKTTTIMTLLIFCFLTASNLSASKTVQWHDIRLTAGFFTYPFVYLFASIIIATRDRKSYMFSITSAYMMYLVFITLMIITTYITGVKSEQTLNQSLHIVFGLGNYRIYLASLLAYFVSLNLFGYIYTNVKGTSTAKKYLLPP